jgi:hypothetical protein
MFEDVLNLRNSAVSVLWETLEPDGMGDWIITVHEQGFPAAAMWSPGQAASYISHMLVSVSDYIMVTLPSYHDFDGSETKIKYAGREYFITGTDNILFLDEIMMVGLTILAP